MPPSGRAARLLRSWVRIPPGAWIFVCCKCRVLSGRGLCDELITRPEKSYRLCSVVVCDLETSRMGAPYIYDISRLRVNAVFTTIGVYHASYVDCLLARSGPFQPCYQTVNITTKLVISSAVVAVRTLQLNGDFPALAILKLTL